MIEGFRPVEFENGVMWNRCGDVFCRIEDGKAMDYTVITSTFQKFLFDSGLFTESEVELLLWEWFRR